VSGDILPPLYAFMAWTGQLRFVQSFSNIVTHSNALLQTGRREREAGNKPQSLCKLHNRSLKWRIQNYKTKWKFVLPILRFSVKIKKLINKKSETLIEILKYNSYLLKSNI
jgi:hypothetical protein